MTGCQSRDLLCGKAEVHNAQLRASVQQHVLPLSKVDLFMLGIHPHTVDASITCWLDLGSVA